MGFDALLFARTHYLDKAARLANKSIEFNWHASDDLRRSLYLQPNCEKWTASNVTDTNLLTGSFFLDMYTAPPNMCFDERCADEPVMDDPNMEDYNVDMLAKNFFDFVMEQVLSFIHFVSRHISSNQPLYLL
jgi:hypothetical protein